MPRPDPRAPGVGQMDIFEDKAIKNPFKLTRGRHSEAMDRALDAARSHDLVDELDEGLLTLLRSGAWALDVLELENKSWGPAKMIPPMIEALREARLTPDSRQSASDDAVATLLEELKDDDDDCTTAPPHTANAGR